MLFRSTASAQGRQKHLTGCLLSENFSERSPSVQETSGQLVNRSVMYRNYDQRMVSYQVRSQVVIHNQIDKIFSVAEREHSGQTSEKM